MRTSSMFLAVLGVTAAAQAQVVLDGFAEKGYGAPVAVQNTQTGFGDAAQGNVDVCFGSEIDGLFAIVDNGVLYLTLSGNLESNFNKLEIFIDGVDGGQNQLRGNNPDVDFNGINRMGDDLATTKVVEGLKFDKGFAADLWVSLTCGGTPFAGYMNYCELLTKGGGFGSYLGTGGAGAAGAVTFKNGFGFGIDNSNIAGVAGGFDIGDSTAAGLVRTGVEVRIPLSAIQGYAGGDLKICAFINGGGHDYMSNQVLGGLGGGPNLAEPRLVDFNIIPGEQFVNVSGGGGGGPTCPADFDDNGTIDAADLAILLGAWGTATNDLDANGVVDAADLAILLGQWGDCV